MSIQNLTEALFRQLNEVQTTQKTGEQLTELIQKTSTVVTVSAKILDAYGLVIDAMIKQGDMVEKTNLPKMLGLDD